MERGGRPPTREAMKTNSAAAPGHHQIESYDGPILDITDPYKVLATIRRIQKSNAQHRQSKRKRPRDADCLPMTIDKIDQDILVTLLHDAEKTTSRSRMPTWKIASKVGTGRKSVLVDAEGRSKRDPAFDPSTAAYVPAPPMKRRTKKDGTEGGERHRGVTRVYQGLSRLARWNLIRIVHVLDFEGGRIVGRRDEFILLPLEGARFVPDPKPKKRASSPNDGGRETGATFAEMRLVEGGQAAADPAFAAQQEHTPCRTHPTGRVDDLCDRSFPVPLPSNPPHVGGTAPQAAQDAAPEAPEDGACAPERSDPPSGAPTTAAARPRAPSTSPRDRAASSRTQEPEPTKGNEQPADHHAGRIAARVVAYFVAKLLPGAYAIDTRNRRRIVQRRVRELLGGPEAARTEAILYAAVDGAPRDPKCREIPREWLCKWVFATDERVRHLAELGARAKARASAPAPTSPRAEPKAAPPPDVDREETARQARAALAMLDDMSRGVPRTVAYVMADGDTKVTRK